MDSSLVVALFYISLILIRPFTVLFHEFGHAIPALLLTQDNVKIYIGSYGDPDKNFKLSLGRLFVYFKVNPLKWFYGLCIHGYNSHLSINIIICLSGSIFSFLIAGSSAFLIFLFNSPDVVKFVSAMLLISSVFDLFNNLIPRKTPIKLHDGTETYNDGQLIVLAVGKHRQLLRVLKGDYSPGKGNLLIEPIVYFRSAEIKRSEGNFQGSVTDLTKAILLDPNNPVYYNNRGYTYLDLSLFEKAILDFNKAIDMDDRYAFAFNNRGFAKLMLGNYPQGLDDILRSLDLDDQNAYAYRNLGLYHHSIGEFDKAMDCYNFAYRIDKNIPLLKEFIGKIRKD